MPSRPLIIVLSTTVLAALGSPVAAGGPEVFTAQGCVKCHSVAAAGVEAAS